MRHCRAECSALLDLLLIHLVVVWCQSRHVEAEKKNCSVKGRKCCPPDIFGQRLFDPPSSFRPLICCSVVCFFCRFHDGFMFFEQPKRVALKHAMNSRFVLSSFRPCLLSVFCFFFVRAYQMTVLFYGSSSTACSLSFHCFMHRTGR